MATKKQINEPTPAPPQRITSVAELQGLIDAPIGCAFQLDGRNVIVDLVRLKPATLEMVRAIQRKAQPEWDGVRKDYDYLSQNFLAKRERANRTARAYALYAGCPIIAQAKPGLVTEDTIYAHVQGVFSEIILELLYQTLNGEGVSLEERVNFTSTADLAPS